MRGCRLGICSLEVVANTIHLGTAGRLWTNGNCRHNLHGYRNVSKQSDGGYIALYLVTIGEGPHYYPIYILEDLNARSIRLGQK